MKFAGNSIFRVVFNQIFRMDFINKQNHLKFLEFYMSANKYKLRDNQNESSKLEKRWISSQPIH